ncbi:MAG: glycosyltransferase family 4 protein [Syntrophomonadaceae bacterium]|nr:glycosyltransferase family 4 protein [Syntrophomonadaceae bacterium]
MMENIFIIILLLLLTIVFSYMLTAMVRIYNVKKNILDVPNERSSHTTATPRAGGLGFVLVILGGTVLLGMAGVIESRLVISLAGSGLMVAGIGLWDDIDDLGARVRMVFHFLAAVWALFWLGGFTEINLGFMTLYLGWWGNILAAAGIAWMINLFNFMDGIDGLAASESISMLLAAALFSFTMGSQTAAIFYVFLACAISGFLISNWPPAKIFMGDTGSCFLGVMFAVLAVASEKSGELPMIIWLLILGVFIIDATVTLILRWHQGQKWYEAHRSHVYQLAVQAGFSHKQVTLGVLTVNCGLFLLAYFMLTFPLLMLPFSLVAALLLTLAHRYLVSYFNKKLLIDKFQSLSIPNLPD